MKRIIFILIFVLSIATAIFAMNPDELNRVTFSNETGYDIVYLFFSPGDSDWWGPDILGSTRYLYDGEVLSFYVHYPDYSNYFDFFAIDEDGDAYYIWNVEISDDEEAYVEISLDNYEPDGPGDIDFTEVVFTNVSDSDIWYLFLSPSDSSMWGIDILDDETIFSVGDSFSILVPVGHDGTTYDMLGLDDDDETLYRQLEVSSKKDEWYIDITEADRE